MKILIIPILIASLTYAALGQNLGSSPISLDPNSRMYSQLLQYEYKPSQRDPFISPAVISPLVIDDEFIDSQIVVDRDKIREAITQLQTYIKSRIKINGIAFGKLGTGYAIANLDTKTNQVIRPGQFLMLPSNSERDRSIVQTAAQMAADAGEAIQITTYENNEGSGLLIFVKEIKDKTIELETPIKSRNISETGVISLSFEKNLIIPKNSQEKLEQNP
jgi:hypothetical protein